MYQSALSADLLFFYDIPESSVSGQQTQHLAEQPAVIGSCTRRQVSLESHPWCSRYLPSHSIAWSNIAEAHNSFVDFYHHSVNHSALDLCSPSHSDDRAVKWCNDRVCSIGDTSSLQVPAQLVVDLSYQSSMISYSVPLADSDSESFDSIMVDDATERLSDSSSLSFDLQDSDDDSVFDGDLKRLMALKSPSDVFTSATAAANEYAICDISLRSLVCTVACSQFERRSIAASVHQHALCDYALDFQDMLEEAEWLQDLFVLTSMSHTTSVTS